MKYLIRRTLAFLIDCIIGFGVAMLVIQWAILAQFREQWGWDDAWLKDAWHMEAYVLLTISLPVWLYFTFFDSKLSKGTFGKRLMGLKLVKTGGHGPSLGTNFLRTALKLAPWEIAHIGVIFPEPLYYMDDPQIRWTTWLGIAIMFIYFGSLFIRRRKKTVYDRWTGTAVKWKKFMTKPHSGKILN